VVGVGQATGTAGGVIGRATPLTRSVAGPMGVHRTVRTGAVHDVAVGDGLHECGDVRAAAEAPGTHPRRGASSDLRALGVA
jgi:hypothetical protein